jgi:hypothetical protein
MFWRGGRQFGGLSGEYRPNGCNLCDATGVAAMVESADPDQNLMKLTFNRRG